MTQYSFEVEREERAGGRGPSFASLSLSTELKFERRRTSVCVLPGTSNYTPCMGKTQLKQLVERYSLTNNSSTRLRLWRLERCHRDISMPVIIGAKHKLLRAIVSLTTAAFPISLNSFAGVSLQ